MGKPIVISVVGDTRDLVSNLGQAENRVGRFGKVAKAGALVAGAGLLAAGAAAVSFVKAAAEDEQSAALMAKQFRNSAKATDAQIASTEKWISKQGLAKGVADDDLRPALSNLVTATGDVSKAQELANLSMDVAAAKNKDLTTVSAQLAKAYKTGNVAALGKLGIATKNAAGETLSFAEVQKNMTAQFGGAAQTKANTFAGVMGRIKLFASETGEAIGYKLLPPLTKAATWFLNKGVPALSKFANQARDFLAPAIDKVRSFIGALVPKVVSFAQAIGTNVLPIITRFASFIGTAVIPAVQAIAAQVATNLKPVFDQLATTFQTRILPTAQTLIAKFKEAQPTLQRVALVVLKVEGFMLKLSAAIIGKVLPVVIRLAGFLISKVVPAVASVAVVIINIIGKLVSFGQKIGQAASKAAGFATTIINTIGKLPTKLAGAVNSLLGVGHDIVAGLVQGIKDKAGDVINTIKDSITDKLPGFVKKALGINSPSKVFAGFGRNIVDGLIVGVKDQAPALDQTMAKLSTGLSTFSTSPIGVSGSTKIALGAAYAGAGGTTINVSLEVPVGSSGADIGRELVGYLNSYYAAGGTQVIRR